MLVSRCSLSYFLPFRTMKPLTGLYLIKVSILPSYIIGSVTSLWAFILLVGLSVIFSIKLHFHAPIGALVSQTFQLPPLFIPYFLQKSLIVIIRGLTRLSMSVQNLNSILQWVFKHWSLSRSMTPSWVTSKAWYLHFQASYEILYFD